ncbi:unnamed protein product, partial [Nesidiocoris tenuis]
MEVSCVINAPMGQSAKGPICFKKKTDWPFGLNSQGNKFFRFFSPEIPKGQSAILMQIGPSEAH